MILDSFCSTIELSAEKEDLVIRLLALLGELEVDVGDVGHALEKLGFVEDKGQDERGDEDEDERMSFGDKDDTLWRRDLNDSHGKELDKYSRSKADVDEGGEEEREGEVGTIRGSEKQQAFVRQLIRDERRQSKEERERSKALKDSLKAEKRKLYAQQQQQQQQERFLL